MPTGPRPLRARLGALRQHAASRGFAATFGGLARVGRLAPQARPERHGLRVIRDVAYQGGDHPAWTLDIYEPQDLDGMAPVVFYVHGGGFRALSKDTHWLMGLAFARRGWRVVNVNYRLAPKHRFPEPAEDICAAFRWTVAHADAYGFDLDRLVFAGESAGANLATMLTIATTFDRPEPWAADVFSLGVRPKVALPACGVLQVHAPEDHLQGHVPVLVRDAILNCCEGYLPPDHDRQGADLASPLHVLERASASDRPLPAVFAPVGGRDPLREDTIRVGAAVRRLGGVAEAKIYPGELHAFHALLWRQNARECWRDMLAFTAEHLDR